MKNKKFNLSGTIAFVLALLVLVIFVPFNLIATYMDRVIDMTPAKKYTLNSITKDLLDETSDKDIDVYFLMSSVQPLKDNPEYLALYHTLTQLDERSNITLECFDPDKNPTKAAELDPLGILGVERGDVFVRCGEITKRISHDKIFQSTTNNEVEYAGEELIAGAVKSCTSGSLPTIYFMQGHGEKSVDDNYSTYAKAVKANNYDAKDIDLVKEGKIPENTAILYLVAPQSDITDTEKDMIMEFLNAGGSISILIPPCETEGRFENIDYILRKYGIEIDYNIVSETNAQNQLQNRDSEQSPFYFRVSYPEKTDEQTVDLTTDVNYVISKGGYIAGISNVRSLAALPQTAYENAGSFEVGSLITNVPNAEGKYTTVSKAMGGDADTAAFADKKLSSCILDFGMYSYNKATGGKILVIGSSDMIDNEGVTYYVSGTQFLTLISNTWLKDIDVEMGIGNKANSYDKLEFANASDAKRVMSWTTILPIGIIIFGVLVWLKRRHS